MLGITACLAPVSAAAQDPSHPPHHLFELGDFPLELDSALPGGRLLYVTHGTLNAERSNAVLVPSWYGGNHPVTTS
jgi:homoserine O-acetyltransferase